MTTKDISLTKMAQTRHSYSTLLGKDDEEWRSTKASGCRTWSTRRFAYGNLLTKVARESSNSSPSLVRSLTLSPMLEHNDLASLLLLDTGTIRRKISVLGPLRETRLTGFGLMGKPAKSANFWTERLVATKPYCHEVEWYALPSQTSVIPLEKRITMYPA